METQADRVRRSAWAALRDPAVAPAAVAVWVAADAAWEISWWHPENRHAEHAVTHANQSLSSLCAGKPGVAQDLARMAVWNCWAGQWRKEAGDWLEYEAWNSLAWCAEGVVRRLGALAKDAPGLIQGPGSTWALGQGPPLPPFAERVRIGTDELTGHLGKLMAMDECNLTEADLGVAADLGDRAMTIASALQDGTTLPMLDRPIGWAFLAGLPAALLLSPPGKRKAILTNGKFTESCASRMNHVVATALCVRSLLRCRLTEDLRIAREGQSTGDTFDQFAVYRQVVTGQSGREVLFMTLVDHLSALVRCTWAAEAAGRAVVACWKPAEMDGIQAEAELQMQIIAENMDKVLAEAVPVLRGLNGKPKAR